MSETLILWPVGVPVGLRSGYGYTPTDTREITAMASGAPKIRDTGIPENSVLTVTLQLSDAELSAFNLWRRVDLSRGTGWINMPLRTANGMINVPALLTKIGKITLAGSKWRIALTIYIAEEI